MKKILLFLLACLTAASLLAACAEKPGENDLPSTSAAVNDSGDVTSVPATGNGEGEPHEIKTFADIFDSCDSEHSFAIQPSWVVCAYEKDGVMWRAYSALPAEISDRIWALDFDENFDSNSRAIIGEMAVETLENLTEMIPAQEELDGYAGKTGEELFGLGFTVSGYTVSDDGDLIFSLGLAPFMYQGVFETSPEIGEDTDYEEALKSLVLRSLTYEGLGNVDLPEDE